MAAAGTGLRLPVVKRRNYADVIGWVLLLWIAVSLAIDVFTNERWNWATIGQYLFDPQILAGLFKTIQLTIYAGASGIALGLIVGLMRLSRSRVLQVIAITYIGLIRSIPALVLILLLYFLSAVFPVLAIALPGMEPIVAVPTNSLLTLFGAAWLGLTLIVGAHSAEIIRGGITSVASGQMEACRALSIRPTTAYRKVILPQAIRVSIPAFATELISLFKNTSLVSVIGYGELLTVAQSIYGRNYQTIPLLMVACAWYLLLTIISMYGQSRLERRFGRGFDR